MGARYQAIRKIPTRNPAPEDLPGKDRELGVVPHSGAGLLELETILLVLEVLLVALGLSLGSLLGSALGRLAVLQRLELLGLVLVELAGFVGVENRGDSCVIRTVELPTGAVAGDDLAVESTIASHLAEEGTEVARLDDLAELDVDEVRDVSDAECGLLSNRGSRLSGGLGGLLLGRSLCCHVVFLCFFGFRDQPDGDHGGSVGAMQVLLYYTHPMLSRWNGHKEYLDAACSS